MYVQAGDMFLVARKAVKAFSNNDVEATVHGGLLQFLEAWPQMRGP